MIGRPAPRTVGNPGPAVERFPNPAAVAVRHPSGVHIRRPAPVVTGNIAPAAITVQILRPGVVTVDVVVVLGPVNHVVAIAVPVVPAVERARIYNLILGALRSLNGDLLARVHVGRALRSGNLRLAVTNRYQRDRIRVNLNAVSARLQWLNGHVGRVDFRICLVVFEHRQVHRASGHLELNARSVQVSDFDRSVFGHPHHIRVVKLNLGAGAGSGGNGVARNQRRVHRNRDPLV